MIAATKILSVVIHLSLYFRYSYQLSCKDEENNDVDWFVNYKIPKIETEEPGTNLGDGKAYAYITAPGSSWKLSSKSITSGSMLENTLSDVYSDQENLAYLFYNDDTPSDYTGTAPGHLKGVVAFDETTGFWLIHSMPRFSDPDKFEYPDNALLNGQSILCVTFRTKELNKICNQLLYSHPNIYASGITSEILSMLDEKAQSLFTEKPLFIRKGELTRIAYLKSLGNKAFISFSKDNQYKDDLFSGIIAPVLKSSLAVETWRRGSGTKLSPSCESDYSVLDIGSINMTLNSGRRKKNISFKSTQDHSKWAIAESRDKKWICIADMNRMKSQENRGGGALCFASSPAWKAYDSIITNTDKCPTRRKSRKSRRRHRQHARS